MGWLHWDNIGLLFKLFFAYDNTYIYIDIYNILYIYIYIK